MAKIEQRGEISCEVVVRLTEAEIRFLEAMVGYGWKSFIEVFESKLGKSYSRDHHAGGKLFFETIGCATGILKRVDEARAVFSGEKQARVPALPQQDCPMDFKCCCAKCGTPLYFEESVPMPQVCFSCLTGQIECDYPRCTCPRFGRCPKLSALPPAECTKP